MTSRSAGRPRRAETDKDILDATARLLAEGGYSALSIEKIAAQAGVSRPTIYRRWTDKDEIVAAAIEATFNKFDDSDIDTGDVRDDLRLRLERLIYLLNHSDLGGIVAALAAERRGNEDLDRLARRIEKSRRRHIIAPLKRGVMRGELPADINYDNIIDLLLGAIYYRVLVTGKPLTKALAQDLVDLVLP